MPRPPPPKEALIISGKPIFSASAGLSEPGTTGTPARWGWFCGRRFYRRGVRREFGAGSDESDAGAFAGAGQGGVFGEEAVARVDEVDALFFGECDDAFDVEVGLDVGRSLRRFGRLRPL